MRHAPGSSQLLEPPPPRGPWLGRGYVVRWSHRLLRPHLPVSIPPLDFPGCGYTKGLAIRDRFGWNRDLPLFTAVLFHHAILIDPESPTGASTQFFPVDNCLRLGDKGSALPSPPSALSSRLRGLWRVNFSRLNRFAFATAWWIAHLLDGPTWDYSRPPRLLLLSLRPTSHLLRTSGMASAPTGQSAPAGLSPA